MSWTEDPDQPRPETPNSAGWATFEARVRARRLAACVDRAASLIDAGHLGEAREAIDEARLLAPDAAEIAELEQRINARPSPGARLLATADTLPVTTEAIEGSRGWPGVVSAIAVVLAVFFAAGYGIVTLRHRFPIPEFLSKDGATPALKTLPQREPESRVAARVPETEVPPAPQVAPPTPAVVSEASQAQPESVPPSPLIPGGTQPADVPAQPDRRTAPPATPPPTIGQRRVIAVPPVVSGSQAPRPPSTQASTQTSTQAEGTLIPEVRPLADPRPVEAVALEMTGPTPTATTGAQPMATLDAPVPGPPPAGRGDSRHDESLRIRAVLLRYENAYNRLDAKAARAVWPDVNEPALNRAFDGLVSQRVSLGVCDITVFGDIAGASCAGKARWEPKVGGGLQTADRYWSFQLTKKADSWSIKEVLVR